MSDSEPVVVDVPTSMSSTKASPLLLTTLQNGSMSDLVGSDSMNDDPLCIVGMGMFSLYHP